jgi:hypothetical protein
MEDRTMFGLGFAVNRVTRHALVACGVDENTAKWIGRGAGWTTSLMTLDPSSLFDVPDIPDGDTPDYSDDSGRPRRHWQ